MNQSTYPADFLRFIESHSGEFAYEFDDIEWWVATEAELATNVNIDGSEYPYAEQLAGYSKALASLAGTASLEDNDGNEYSLTRLASGLAFATGDGDVLFFDPADGFSVWHFEHDGGEFHRLVAIRRNGIRLVRIVSGQHGFIRAFVLC